MLEHGVERSLFFFGFLDLIIIRFLFFMHFLDNCLSLFLSQGLLLNQCFLLFEFFLKTFNLLEETNLECKELDTKSMSVSYYRKSQLIQITSRTEVNLVEKFKHNISAVTESSIVILV